MVSILRMIGYVGLIVLVTVVERYNLYRDRNRIKLRGRQQHNISIVTLALISLLFGLYSIAITRIPYALDRGNYAIAFSENWSNPYTVGLNLLYKILIPITNDPKILFFTVTFLSAFLVLLAHRMNHEAKPNTLLYLVLSEFFIYSFYFLKQAPAMALVAIATTMLLQEKKLLSLLFLVSAVLFHEAAFIIIPVYVLVLCADIQWARRSSYILMVLVVIFFIPFSRVTIKFFGTLIPRLLVELHIFLDDTGAMRQAINIPTTLKGVPFYLITLYGFRRRKEYIGLIQHYDQYMIMSVFVSITVLLSAYMYWMWRFGTFFFFPIFVFASQLASVNKDDKQDKLFSLLLMASLGFWTLRYLWRMFYHNGGF